MCVNVNHKTIKQSLCITMRAAYIFMILAVSSAQAQDCSKSQGFKQGAENFVKVHYRSIFRSGITKQVYTQAEVKWQPNQMVAVPDCYDLAAAELQLRPVGSDKWQLAAARQLPDGKYAKWTVDIKPCLKYEFQIQLTGNSVEGGEAFFLLPETVGPAPEEEILKSRYKPSVPTNFRAVVGATSAELVWDISDCADAYEISFKESGEQWNTAVIANAHKGEDRVNVDSLKPCTRYETSVMAKLGQEYSDGDLQDSFATKPRLDSAASLAPEVNPTLNSVQVSWKAWESVSCIDQYQIKICPKNADGPCRDPMLVTKPTGLPTVTFTASELEPCTDYTMEIQPQFPDTEIESKFVDFRTLSPSADTLSVERVSAVAVTSGSMMVSWTTTKCAAGYRVYQKETQASNWSLVADTPSDENEITVDNITPCTKYHFAISAVLADQSETSQSIGPELISDLDENDPFTAPNLYIMNGDRHAEITWGHADCISSYLVKVCQRAYTDCHEEPVDPNSNSDDKTIHYRVENLEPCTHYSLEIIPVIPGKQPFSAKPSEFTTTNGVPQAPEEFKVVLVDGSSTALSWAPAQCATGYKIYEKEEENQEADVAKITGELEENIENMVPCKTYFFSISTVVDEKESARTEWFNVAVPPNKSALPELKVLSREKGNVTVRLEPAAMNSLCSIADYELRYSSDGGATFAKEVIKAEKAKGGDIMLNFPGATEPETIIAARVKYAGTDTWSGSVSTGGVNARMRSGKPGLDTTALIPIIVGVAVLAVIVIVITILILRRKKSRMAGFDTEKANENGNNRKPSHHHNNVSDEETQKLNANQEDA